MNLSVCSRLYVRGLPARSPRWAALVLALCCLLSSPALAHAAESDDEDWGFSFAPYGWLLSLSGDVGVDGRTVDVDLPFHDILDDLEFGFMGVLEVRYGRWFASLDSLVSQLEADARFGPTNADADLDLWLTKLKLTGGYRVLSRPLGADDDPRRLTVDAYAGGRFWYVDSDVKLDFPILANRRFSSDIWWIDPVVGACVRGDATERLVLAGVVDIGGFGIGSASEFTWELQGTLNYRLTDRWTLSGGYRAIGIDRERGVDGLDGTLHGPIFGAVYAWGGGTR